MTPQGLLAGERRRAMVWALAVVLPAVAWAGVALGQQPASPLRWLLLTIALIAAITAAGWAWQAHDARWLARRLDRVPALEDSAGLLFDGQANGSPLAALQRERIAARLPSIDRRRWQPRRPAWPILVAWQVAGIGIAWMLLRPAMPQAVLEHLPAPIAQALQAGPPHLQAVRLTIRPPGYTGLPVRHVEAADTRVPQSSRVDWQLHLGGAVRAAWLEWDDGRRLALQHAGGRWIASRTFERGALYRIVTDPALPAAQSALHRIEVIADRPPQVRAVEPARTLVLRTPGQRQWRVRFLASDDHGVAATARLRIIQTAGEGENITSSERTLVLTGSGPPTRRSFAYTADLARSGLTIGNDLILQLTVHDHRRPQPQTAGSGSVILRWPPEKPGEVGGLDLQLKRALPAYFRSQRQIIIDAEKLLAEKPRLTADAFLQRSDTLGVDQRALRLRYGQFMGEEAEDGPALPTSDVEPHADADGHDDAGRADHTAEADTAGGQSHTGHDHAAPQRSTAEFAAAAEAVAAELAHTHDVPEAATFFDPNTREMLRTALREMWSSEGELRGGDPAAALPFARRALEWIKKLQQADRVYLPRLGSEIPPIDMARRLTGKRDGLAGRSDPFLARPRPADPLAGLWQALAADDPRRAIDAQAIAAAEQSLRARAASEDGALTALAALDRLQREPACVPCRAGLREALWPLLQAPVPRPTPRQAPDALGEAYLDALRRGGTR